MAALPAQDRDSDIFSGKYRPAPRMAECTPRSELDLETRATSGEEEWFKFFSGDLNYHFNLVNDTALFVKMVYADGIVLGLCWVCFFVLAVSYLSIISQLYIYHGINCSKSKPTP